MTNKIAANKTLYLVRKWRFFFGLIEISSDVFLGVASTAGSFFILEATGGTTCGIFGKVLVSALLVSSKTRFLSLRRSGDRQLDRSTYISDTL